MPTVRDTLTTDSNGDGSSSIKLNQRVLVANLRGYFDAGHREYFRIYITILVGSETIDEGGAGGGDGRSGPASPYRRLSAPKLSGGIIVEPNETIKVNVEAGTKYATDECHFAFDYELV